MAVAAVVVAEVVATMAAAMAAATVVEVKVTSVVAVAAGAFHGMQCRHTHQVVLSCSLTAMV